MRFKIILSLVLSQILLMDVASAMFGKSVGELWGPASRVVRTSLRSSSFKVPEYVEHGYLCPSYTCKKECLYPQSCSLQSQEDRLELRRLEEQAKRRQWKAEARESNAKGMKTFSRWALGTSLVWAIILTSVKPLSREQEPPIPPA